MQGRNTKAPRFMRVAFVPFPYIEMPVRATFVSPAAPPDTARSDPPRTVTAGVSAQAPGATIQICTMSGANFELPLPEAASVADLRAAIASRLQVGALSFSTCLRPGERSPWRAGQ